MQGMYSMRSPAVKRLMKEAQELREPTEQYHAQPLEDNLFEWHFTLRGPEDSEFDGGIYHGRIILPPEYPMKPPSIIILTPNGRFEINKKICLSISGHHPESWQPSWSIRTALLAIIGFMPTHGAGALGSLDYSKGEREKLAKRSLDWKCQTCGRVNSILKPVTEASEKTKQEAKELASQINFQGEKPKLESSNTEGQTSNTEPSPSTTPIRSEASSNQQQTFFQFPGQIPGQFPGQPGFGHLPFPFPFIPPTSVPGQAATPQGLARFPAPPPVIPAMLPPGFLPYPGSGSMFGGYPWHNASTTSASAIPTSTVNVPAATSGLPVVTSSGNTSPVGATSSEGTTSSSNDQSNVKTNVQKSEKTEDETKTTNLMSTSSTENLMSGNEASSESSITRTDASSKNTTDVTEIATDSEQSSNSNSANTSNREGLRQRSTVLVNPTPAPPQRGTVGQTAELDTPRRSSGHFSMVLIVLLSIALGLLLIRRFLMSSNWRFNNFGF